MKQKDFTGIVPSQYTGKEIETAASIDLKDNDEAKLFYEVVRERLFNVNKWHSKAGFVSGSFQLMDANGKKLEKNVEIGDYIRIDIPGPGSSEGFGYDWVLVEDLREIREENIQSVGFRVRPSQNPANEDNATAHFYSDEATSSFIVSRENNTVSSLIIDRNVKPNTDASTITDKIRHVAVSLGAIGLFSKVQWQNLANGLVKKN